MVRTVANPGRLFLAWEGVLPAPTVAARSEEGRYVASRWSPFLFFSFLFLIKRNKTFEVKHLNL